MRTIIYSGLLEARTGLINGGKSSGNYHSFRREQLITPEGKIHDQIPVVSGSVIRGDMRRIGAQMMQQVLVGADGKLPMDIVNAFRSGGNLREARKSSTPLTGENQARLRELVPMLALFGVNGGGRMMSGRLTVDKGFPLAKETAHLAEHYGTDVSNYKLSGIRELLQVDTFTRIADVEESIGAPFVTPEDYTALDDKGKRLKQNDTNMIYYHESLSPGTRLLHKVVVQTATANEVSFFDDLMRVWSTNATIGGQKARGMGQVVPHYERQCLDLLGEPAPEMEGSEPGVWKKYVQDNLADVLEALSWL